MTVPAVVRYAGYLVAVQGIAGLVVAVVYLGHTLTGANQDQVRGLALGGFGYGTAAWFTLIGGAVLAAGWALVTGRRWGRGGPVFANLLLLGVAWYLRGSGQPLYAALVAVLCLVVLGFLFSPAAVQWVTRSRDELS